MKFAPATFQQYFGYLVVVFAMAGCTHAVQKPILPNANHVASGVNTGGFEDVAEKIGVHFKHSSGGTGRYYFVEQIGSGCAFIDYDGDGNVDIFAVNGAPLPGYTDRRPLHFTLWHNLGNGKFKDVTENSGLGITAYGTGVCVADYDNDGKPDIFVAGYPRSYLFHNLGNGKFEEVAEKAGVKGPKSISTSATFVDVDNDGFVDLYVCRYVNWELEHDRWCGKAKIRKDFCGPEVYPPHSDTLYHNNRNGTFTEVTVPAGIFKPKSKSLGVVATDLNNDGWPDIYVANDLEPNLCFMNQGNGKFKERGVELGVAFGQDGGAEAGMGVAAGDYRNDGNIDLFVTNYSFEMYALYRNTGKDVFTYESVNTGIGPATLIPLGFGTAFVDFDNDGWADIVTANGHVLDDCHEINSALEYAQTMQLFQNEGGKRFTDVSGASGPAFKSKFVGRGMAIGDIDNDGRLDFVVNNMNGPLRVIHNNVHNDNHWIGFTLTGTLCNRSAIGARVTVKTANGSYVKEVYSGSSFLSQNDFRLVFGLGAATNIESISIRWPGHGGKPGESETWKGLAVDHYHKLTEGSSKTKGN